jgi:hypothetical protein
MPDGHLESPGPPPLVSNTPPLIAGPLPVPAVRKDSSGRRFVAVLLSACVSLFLADAVVAVLDTSLVLFLNNHALGLPRQIVAALYMLVAVVIYVLMAFTRMISKRIFVPLTLFNFLAGLAFIPVLIYASARVAQVAWLISVLQLLVGIGVLTWLHPGLKLRMPPVSSNHLCARGFSWANLCLFLLANVFLLVPAVAVYLFLCASMAVGHFSEGFIALKPGGLTVQTRKYVRADGKTVQLVPMAHVAEADFYQNVSQSFPTNALILMEGVTDRNHLLTNKITYTKMASTLGLSEQQQEFKPIETETMRADVDVEQFSTNTIGFLNLAMRIHSKGVTFETVLPLLHYSPPPDFEEQLWDDLLTKRNEHLVEELKNRLADSDAIIIPWGAAHMPGISKEILKAGFRVEETKDYKVVRFGSRARKGR